MAKRLEAMNLFLVRLFFAWDKKNQLKYIKIFRGEDHYETEIRAAFSPLLFAKLEEWASPPLPLGL